MVPSIPQRLEQVDQRARGAVLGVGRIGLGLLWLANLHWKVPPDFGQDNGGGLYKYTASVSRHSPLAAFTWVTEEIILPNFRFFGWVTLLGETTLAMLLIVGYRTKLVAIGGAIMPIPIMLSVIYYDRGDEWSWSYLLMVIAHLLVYASDAGNHLGIDGVLRRGPAAANRSIRIVGAVAVALGAAGLFVARSVSFAGSKVALLGSDAGFVNDDGTLVRRWELKFVWFNPLWALLTIALGVVVLAVRQQWATRAAGLGFAAMAVVILAFHKFDYVRDDGKIQSVATASNAAMWGALAIALLLAAGSVGRIVEPSSDSMQSTP